MAFSADLWTFRTFYRGKKFLKWNLTANGHFTEHFMGLTLTQLSSHSLTRKRKVVEVICIAFKFPSRLQALKW